MSSVSIVEKHLVPGEEEGELLRLHAEFCNRLTSTEPLKGHSMSVFSLAGVGQECSMVSKVHSFDLSVLSNISNSLSTRTLERNTQTTLLLKSK